MENKETVTAEEFVRKYENTCYSITDVVRDFAELKCKEYQNTLDESLRKTLPNDQFNVLGLINNIPLPKF